MICGLLKVFDIDTGRGRGIRTPGTRKGSPVFKTGAINRSTIPLFTPPVLEHWMRVPFLRTAKLMENRFLQKNVLKIVYWSLKSGKVFLRSLLS